MSFNDFKIDSSTGDISIENGDFVTIDGREAIAQNISQRLKTIVGEWFLDVTVHIDYFNSIFEKGTSARIIEVEIRNVIAGTPGFIEFQSFSLETDTETRDLIISFVADTVEGVVELNEILSAQEI